MRKKEYILKRKSVNRYFCGMKGGKETFSNKKKAAFRFTDIDKCTSVKRKLKTDCNIEHLLGEELTIKK